MATRYWVGGAGNWSSTTKWSATSGGASGASVPGSLDNVIFDANSGLVGAVATVDTAVIVDVLQLTPGATVGFSTIAVTSSLNVNTIFTMSTTTGNKRFVIRGTTYGLATNLSLPFGATTASDLDLRDLIVTYGSSSLTGTRLGNLGGVTGVTFSTPKTVYWNLAGAQDWSANGWAPTSGGTPATTSFPLAQDTAVFDNTGSVTGVITMDAAIPYTGTVDMSARSSAMTLATTAFTIYGDWKNGSGTTLSGTAALTYSGRNTQSITSAGKTFTQALTVDTYGGTVQLADALNTGTTNGLTVTNGTFDTKNFNVTAAIIASSGTNVRTIALGSSTVTLVQSSPIQFATTTNMTLNAGTSSVICNNSGPNTFNGGNTNLVFYNVSFTVTSAAIHQITGSNTFNNVSITAPASAGITQCTFSANQTITGTLTCAGATAVRRIFLRSDTIGTQRTLTVGTLSAQDCDFRDIVIAGAAAGSSPTRAGDCGGNSGITFPGAKTVYWNLAGAQNWSATGWCPSSGGTPDINQFPLAQDTAVFDNTGSVTGAITIDAAWNIGTFNASARTSAMTLSTSAVSTVYGNWLFGTGVTSSSTTSAITFGGRGTQTITSNGVAFGCPVTIDSSTGTVQLADALTLGSARTLTLTSGTFDAVSYNVTTGLFSASSAIAGTVWKMGSGTWTLSGVGAVLGGVSSNVAFYKGTANILLSDTSTTARTFAGGSLSYNKLTIGGTTGVSTLTISGNSQFTEIASTKTVAHTIALGATTQTVGAWTVTGTVGNVVTVTGTATLTIAGARVSGVDYLALGTTTLSATSPGEFYAGANSTGGTNFILTAAPSAVTRYWRGGTGTWDATTTTNWSDTSGGSGGFSVPTSADAVVFDTLSNATAYTVTATATQLRCAALTMAGPAIGNVTWAGTAPLAIHGNVTLPASGLTRSYTGTITFTGSATGKTFTTNGVTIAGNPVINGIGCGWSLGSAWSDGGSGTSLTVTNGSFSTANYNVTIGGLASSNSNTRSISLGSSAVSIQTLPGGFSTSTNLTFSAGTSTITCTSSGTFNGGGLTFYNVSFTGTFSSGDITVNGANTFNNLSFSGATSSSINSFIFSANQTISGTLTLSAGTDATMRAFLRSSTLGTTRTLTCAAFAGTDADFRDITIAGAAAPVSGTRLGDAKGNSGITFGAGVTKYWNLAAGGNWSAVGWATTSGGTPAVNNFPLAQDTAIFEATGLNSGATITINANYNVGTINMAGRTSNTMTLATGTTTPAIYGNWINGTGTTLTGTGTMTFAGRGSQTITSAGVTFTQSFTVNNPGGTITQQDDLINSFTGTAFIWSSGNYSMNNYNASFSGPISITGATLKTFSIGSGTLTNSAASTAFNNAASNSLTVTGTGTISLTSGSTKTFSGNNFSYSGITLNQGGAGTLTISGNNTFKNITNTYSATGATTINFAATSTTVSQFTAVGTAGNLLTISGTSAASPATLIYTGASTVGSNYLTINNVRAYSLSTTWYAGANSTNGGSLGWIFSAAAAAAAGSFFFMF